MDLRKLKTLIDLVSDSNVSELEITEAEGKVRIVKSGPMMAPQAYGMSMQAMPIHAMAQQTPQAAAPDAALSAPAAPAAPANHVVKSPMVGTFYRSASPGAKAFVELGDSIKQGDTICIIEAMKILNEIEADKTGVVSRILSQNGEAVEYGQALFEIE